jgi:hypothetical protein
MAALILMGIVAPAFAAPGYSVVIPIDTVVRAPEGSQTALATSAVPAEAVGQVCSVVSHAANQRSIHPNNDLIVDSGASQVVLPDVESVPNSTVEATGPLTLGSSIEVSLLMGEDEVFSGGFDIVVECELQPGRVIVIKEVTEGSDTSQAFDFSADYADGGFSLSDGEQHDSGELDPGTYAVSENELTGWTLQSATCDDGSPVGAIEVAPGETVTCTFVNEQAPPEPGRIIVIKEVTEGSDTAQVFDFSADYADGGFSLSDGQQNDSGDLESGTYSVSETDLEGWTLESATCDDGSPVGAIEVSSGETVTCTFVNDFEIEDEVMASIVVTFSTQCEVDGDEEVGLIDVGVSVPGGAQVVIRDSNGAVVGSVSDDSTLIVSAGSSYSWEANPNEGFEFPVGSATSGTLSIESCLEPDVLPFTGPDTDGLVVLASTLVASGFAILAFERRRLES